MAVIIRKYKSDDRAAVRKIFNDTAFFGDPIEAYFLDRDFFADFFTLYHTDYEGESVFIAEDVSRREVVGYLTGCLATAHLKKFFYPKVALKLFSGLFKKTVVFNKKSASFLWRLVKSGLKGENNGEKFLDYNRFPSSLHINISPGYRGRGIGAQLMSAFLQYLKDKNTNGVHLGVFSVNEKAIKFYEKHGFMELARFRSTLYDNFFPGRDVYLIYMGKALEK